MKIKQRSFVIFSSGLLLGIGIFALIAYKKIDPNPNPTTTNKDSRVQYKWYIPEVPTSIDFCGETVPLDRWDVKEKLERELLNVYYQHSTELYTLMLAGRYFPIIEARLKANGVPDDFKYLCVAESSLHQNAISAAGAVSFWQFMKDTGPRYGLEINDEVDQRFDVEKATDASCKYFKESFAKFGSWTSAAASYNCGQAGFTNQCDFQKATNYYDLIFPDETNRYVFRILSLKYLLSNAKKLGLYLEVNEEYKPLKYKTIEVSTTIDNLTDFAISNHTTYKMLKIYNPWLRAHKLTVKAGKKYIIDLPDEK